MAKLDILFITPPSRLEVYQTMSGSLAAIEPPVWSGLIANFMRRRGYDVAILDAEAEGLTHEETARRAAAAEPRLTVFMVYGQQPSASTQCMPGGRKTALALAEEDGGDIPTLVIGTHASALPRRTLLEEPYTYVCGGEGPYTVLGLIEALKGKGRLEDVPGLWFRDQDGAPVSNKPAALIEDLDGVLPGQALDLLDMTRYRAHNWHSFHDLGSRDSYASLQTSLAYPGSQLYTVAREKGWRLPDDDGPGWIGYSQHAYDCLPLATEHLTAGQVLAFRDKAFTTYFTDRNYLDMIRSKFGQLVVDHIADMSAHHLRRDSFPFNLDI